MANYSYNDWITQATPAAQAQRLRLHIAEVSDRIDAATGNQGESTNTDTLQKYLDTLFRQLKELDPGGIISAPTAAAGVTSGFTSARARTPS